MSINISGSGIVEANLADNAVTLAKMAHGTDGELITYDATGAPANVAVGTSGQVLTSGGVGVAPTFQTAAAGGKVLQVVSSSSVAYTYIINSSVWTTNSGYNITITPATGSKVIISYNCGGMSYGVPYKIGMRIKRGSTIVKQTTGYGYEGASNSWKSIPVSFECIDTAPGGDGSTAITYSLEFNMTSSISRELYINNYGGTASLTVIATEIGA